MQIGTWLGAWLRTTSSHQRPSQIALAVTCGMLLGLLPKSSGLFFVFAAFCYLLPTHLPLLAATAIAFSILTPVLVGPIGQTGIWSLTQQPLAALWMRLDSFPLVPWLGMHNSIVNGSLVIWLVASVPVFLTSLLIVRAVTDSVSPVSMLVFEQAIDGAVAVDIAANQELRPLSAMLSPGESQTVDCPPVTFVSEAEPTSTFDLDKPNYITGFEEQESHTDFDLPSNDEIIQRASQLAEWADELITAELKHDEGAASSIDWQPALGDVQPSLPIDADLANDKWLIETTMEVVRIAEQAVSQQAALKFKPMHSHRSDVAHSVPEPDATTQVNTQPTEITDMSSTQGVTDASAQLDGMLFKVDPSGIDGVPTIDSGRGSDLIRRQQTAHGEVSNHFVARRPADNDQPREEALRYLLRHLKGIQDKVQNQ